MSPYNDSVNTKKAGCQGFLDVKDEDLKEEDEDEEKKIHIKWTGNELIFSQNYTIGSKSDTAFWKRI